MVIFKIKLGSLAFEHIFSAEGGQIWTNDIKQNMSNFLTNLTLTLKFDFKVIFNFVYYFFQKQNLDKLNILKLILVTSRISYFLCKNTLQNKTSGTLKRRRSCLGFRKKTL